MSYKYKNKENIIILVRFIILFREKYLSRKEVYHENKNKHVKKHGKGKGQVTEKVR